MAEWVLVIWLGGLGIDAYVPTVVGRYASQGNCELAKSAWVEDDGVGGRRFGECIRVDSYDGGG